MATNIKVITSKLFAKSGGIQTVTQTLFRDVYPIIFFEDQGNISNEFEAGDVALFSGFNQGCAYLVDELKEKGVKVAVFWHFSTTHEEDPSIRADWLPLFAAMGEGKIDAFISCKENLPKTMQGIFADKEMKGFFILNNSFDSAEVAEKDGLGIYSGSSDYWVKNIRTNLHACLATGMNVDVLPYEPSLKAIVQAANAQDRVTGPSGGLPHDKFVERMAGRELVTYCTITEGAPILPLEALNSGTICLTGDNHHYWKEDPVLRDYLVVADVQDPFAIQQAIQRALENKEEILERYAAWKSEYDVRQKANFEDFQSLLESL